MTKFVNLGEDVDVYAPAGHPDSLFVESGQVVDMADQKVEDGGDCWLVGEGDNVRAWPKSRWEKQGTQKKDDKSAEKSTDKPASKTADKPAPDKGE